MLHKIAGKLICIDSLYLLIIILLPVMVGCAGPKNITAGGASTSGKSIYLVAHDWHAGIVVQKRDIPKSIWPQHSDFPNAEYLEVGWGDGDFYQAREIRAGLALKALLLPTSAVLHVVGFRGSVSAYFPHSDILEFQVSREDFTGLCRFIEKAYAKDEQGRSVPLGPGLYGDSRFYASSQNYHLFRTCNVWSAGALRAAGLPVSPWFTFTVEELFSKAEKYGTHIQSAAKKK